jgi:hypothetical protein
MFERTGPTEERTFAELRRKILRGGMLSPGIETLLRNLRFTGRLCVVVQNGCIIKSGYEEGYFSRRHEDRLVS